MKPPYEITNTILELISSISESIGAIKATHLVKPTPQLRRQNRIQTIHSSLAIEGNTLSEKQITDIIDNKPILGPQKDIQEVKNAIATYDILDQFDAGSLESFLNAHKFLMHGLIDQPGQLRTRGVGVVKGTEVVHMAPPADRLPYLIKTLLRYVDSSDDHPLIKSCVAHYEIEFIHPFLDGNGRMGRLWQTVILLQAYPVFEFLPFESIIKKRQQEYYDVLAQCDNEGKSTRFIEYMLTAINTSLLQLLKTQNRSWTAIERIQYFVESFSGKSFTRKDYLLFFKEISAPTASRDLRMGVEKDIWKKKGDGRTSVYELPK